MEIKQEEWSKIKLDVYKELFGLCGYFKNSNWIPTHIVTKMEESMQAISVDGLGVKHDGDKLPWHLLPYDALEEVVKVLGHGGKKYGERNWERGMIWSRPFSALHRHLKSWFNNEGDDSDSGLSHLAHAACCILFLLAYEKRGLLSYDDRPKAETASSAPHPSLKPSPQ